MRRTLSTLTALAVGAATLSAAATTASADEAVPDHGATSVDKPLWQQAQSYYSTLRIPRVVADDALEQVDGPRPEPTWWQEAQRRHATGFPPAAQELPARGAGGPRASARAGASRRPARGPVTHGPSC